MEYEENPKDLIEYTALLARKGGVRLVTFQQEASGKKVKPDDSEYAENYMRRYFCTKTNDPNSVISEIPVEKYVELRKNPFFRTYELKWKINGAIRNIYDQGILLEQGVFEYNEISFKKLRKKLPNIGESIRDLTEFYKN